MRHGVGIHPVSLEDPTVAMYPILCYYNMPQAGVLPLFFPVRKFLQLPVQDPMGSLARPVWWYQTHDDAWTQEYGHDDQCGLHIKYICYGCCEWSCSTNRSIMRCISDLMCCISSYTTARWCGSTYSNCWNNSHKFIMRICRSSFNSKTAKVFSWKATAEVSMTAYSMTVRTSIQLFNEYVWIHFFGSDRTHLY